MATKDISDLQVVRAIVESQSTGSCCRAIEVLKETTGQCEKVCYSAMDRACRRGLIDYGVSLRCAFLTESGKELFESHESEVVR